MTNIARSFQLDTYLLKYYKKSILFVILIPVIFIFINRSLLSGISFSMTFMAMASSYTFSISEKNDMHRLYGILPVSKADLVIGRYLLLLGMGIFTLLVSLFLDNIALKSLNVAISSQDLLISGLVGIAFYIFYISFQLPGYYKFGSIRGRMFMYIPVLGFLLITFLLPGEKIASHLDPRFISENPMLFIIGLFIILLGLYTISILISIRILKNKEG